MILMTGLIYHLISEINQTSFLMLLLCCSLSALAHKSNKPKAVFQAKKLHKIASENMGLQSFINIDCGATASNRDDDEMSTGLFYELDTKYTDTGENHEISPNTTELNSHQQQRHNLRSFPQGKRNCYTLNPKQGGNNNYLIRAVFEYGNYDGNNTIPVFDLYIGVNRWTNVSGAISIYEIIHVPSADYIDVCLVNIGKGVPYISALELRPLNNSIYRIQNGELSFLQRIYIHSPRSDIYRYPKDVFDRLWYPLDFNDWGRLPRNGSGTNFQNSGYEVPPQVLENAATVNSRSRLSLYFKASDDASHQHYIYFHFAELQKFTDGNTRELRIDLNGEGNLIETVILDEYQKLVTVNTTFQPIESEEFYFSIYVADDSCLPPILNAVEIYEIIDLPHSPTNLDDVHAIRKIKSVYGVKRNWQGDPCLPQEHHWDGVICSNDSSSNPPRIISLNLSWTGLTGEIDPSFASLTALKNLSLNGNKLTGLVPPDLMEKSKNGSLLLSVEGNPDICLSASLCKKKKNEILVPVIASIAAFSVALIAILAIFWRLKMRKKQATVVLGKSENKKDTFAAKKKQFTYSDIVEITKNFKKVLGKGGFGTVYHGYLDDTEVAVKLLSSSSTQGYKEFHSEVKLLMRVHHRNLTSLVGYCIEGTHMGIIYEYMTNGSLDQYFSGKREGKNASILSWEDRMRIAVDAAQGLEYLHDGCKPPIIHRDVKSSNILLNEKLQAKIADFGMSRIFPIESGSHVCTGVAGTPGYLDPEYYSSNRLNEKSDIYSFGVVLLEIITSRPVILTALETTHLSKWVNSMLAGGDIRSIVDPKLSGDFEINSAWKAVELALACTSQSSSERPTMIEAVMELKECLALATARNGEGHPGNKTKGPRRMLTIDVIADESSPSAR